MEKIVESGLNKSMNKTLYELAKVRKLCKEGSFSLHELIRIQARAKAIMGYGQLLLNMTEEQIANLQGT